MTNTEIVMKLIGNVKPIGETNYDKAAKNNLIELCQLIEDLTSKVFDVAIDCRGYQEHSIKMCQEYAKTFLLNQANNVKEYLQDEQH